MTSGTDKVETYYNRSLVDNTSDVWQDTMSCHGTDNTYYMVLNEKEVQILIGQFLHISRQTMRRHYRDNGDIDIGCRVRQIVDYMFTRCCQHGR